MPPSEDDEAVCADDARLDNAPSQAGSSSPVPPPIALSDSAGVSGSSEPSLRTSRRRASDLRARKHSLDSFQKIQDEIESLVMMQSPRGFGSDRRGLLGKSILQMVNEAVEIALTREREQFQRQIDELQERLDQLEERLANVGAANPESSPPTAKKTTGFKASLLARGSKKKEPRTVPGRDGRLTAAPMSASTPPLSGSMTTRDRSTSSPLQLDSPYPLTVSATSSSLAARHSEPSPITASRSSALLGASHSPASRASSSPDTDRLLQEAALVKIQQAKKFEDPSPLLDMISSLEDIDSFHFETGATVYRTLAGSPTDSLALIDPHLDENFYLANFFGLPQTHYYLPDDPASPVGPVLISVREPQSKSDTTLLGLVRTQYADVRIKLNDPGKKKRVAELLAVANLPADVKLTPIEDELLTRRLMTLEHESINEHRQYKFGILLAHDDQTEDEMFANDATPEFEEFLAFLGQKIELHGWKKYRAGLDTKSGTTGDHSVYQRYQNHQVMFHVSTLLPKTPGCSQQLERKRHLGNDVCLIVFHDGVKPFKPSLIHSHFNNVFIVVRPVAAADVPESVVRLADADTQCDSSSSGSVSSSSSHERITYAPSPSQLVYYKIAAAVKRAAPAHKITPYLPNPPIMPNNAKTLEFLLVKLINAERAVMHAKEFQERSSRTRRLLLASIIDEHCKS